MFVIMISCFGMERNLPGSTNTPNNNNNTTHNGRNDETNNAANTAATANNGRNAQAEPVPFGRPRLIGNIAIRGRRRPNGVEYQRLDTFEHRSLQRVPFSSSGMNFRPIRSRRVSANFPEPVRPHAARNARSARRHIPPHSRSPIEERRIPPRNAPTRPESDPEDPFVVESRPFIERNGQ